MSEFGLTDDGFVAPRSTDLLDQIRTEYENRTGLSIDWADDLFLGIMTQVIAEVAGRQSEMLQAIADSRDPDNATGHQLDTLASIVGVERLEAEFSAVDLDLGGDAGTIVEEGSEVEHPKGTLWYTQDTVEIPATVEARPEETGPITAEESTDWEINTPVEGWDSVESQEDATLGRNRETDAQLRLRRQQSLQVVGAAARNAIRSNILEVEGVDAAVVVENDTSVEQTIDGLTLDPKSFSVVVYPALTIDQSEELAAEIYRRAPVGIKSIGDESATVTGEDGFDKTIRWNIANEVTVNVDVEYTGESGLESDIESVVTGYFEGLDVGDAARRLPILGAISDIENVDTASVELDGAAQDVEIEITEIAIEGTTTVTEV